MAARDVEVRTKLTLDDQASGALNRIKEGFTGANEASKGASQGMGFFTSTMANFAAMSIVPAIRGVFDFAKGFVDAAAAGERADRAVAGFMMASQAIPWTQAIGQANELGDALDDIAINSGVAGEQIEAAFRAMLEVGGGSADNIARARSQLEQMATIAGVTGMNTEAMAREFSFMGEGVLRTKGQLFQLLQTTGIFGADTKKAAEYWSKLTEAQRMDALASGLSSVADKMKGATPGFNQLLTSIETMWDVAKEKLGEPLLNAMIPVLKDLVDKFKASRGEIEKWAQAMSKDVKAWVEDAGKAIQEGFTWIKDHQTEIKNAIVEGARTAKEVVEFILAHKEEIAIAFGVKAAAPVVSAGVDVAKGVTGLAAQGIPGLGIAGAGGGMAAAGVALAAFTAAVVAAALAADQAAKLYKETGGGRSEGGRDLDSRVAYARQVQATAGREWRQWTPQEVSGFGDIRAKAVKGAADLGENSRAVGEAFDAAWSAHMDAVGRMRAMGDQFAKANAEIEKLTAEGADPGTAESIAAITTMFNTAASTQNQGMAVYMATLLAKNQNLADTFLFTANLTGQSIDAFVGMVEGKAEGIDALIKQLKEKAGQTQGAPTAAPAKVSMSGGQTFNIKQEFRDQDPDRVAFVFRRDIIRAAENRIQATTTSPFGT